MNGHSGECLSVVAAVRVFTTALSALVLRLFTLIQRQLITLGHVSDIVYCLTFSSDLNMLLLVC
jgi:hypothetical protein